MFDQDEPYEDAVEALQYKYSHTENELENSDIADIVKAVYGDAAVESASGTESEVPEPTGPITIDEIPGFYNGENLMLDFTLNGNQLTVGGLAQLSVRGSVDCPYDPNTSTATLNYVFDEYAGEPSRGAEITVTGTFVFSREDGKIRCDFSYNETTRWKADNKNDVVPGSDILYKS